MTFDTPPSTLPPEMTFEQMLELPLSESGWRESSRYVCGQCIQPAFHHPYTNKIWGCRECGTRTIDIAQQFVSLFQSDSIDADTPPAPAEPPNASSPSEPFPLEQTLPAELTVEAVAPELSPFSVQLRRVPPSEQSVDPTTDSVLGTRTKLGGSPDWIQMTDDTPLCTDCRSRMTFVAQIDSIEHISLKNPFGTDFKERDRSKQAWMFCDVGMIYVFYCFGCHTTQSITQCH